jgi:hypothetical protein
VVIFQSPVLHVGDVFMRLLLPAFRVEQNDRAFVSLDRASGVWFTALQLLTDLRSDP